MGINIGKITNKVAAGAAIGDKLGLFKKKKKDREAEEQGAKRTIEAAEKTNMLSSLQFPSDIGKKYFFMKFKKYAYGTSGNVNKGEDLKETLSGYIILPFPRELTEEYNVAYRGAQLGYFGAGAEALNEALNGNEEFKTLTKDNFKGLIPKAGKAIAGALTASLVQNVGSKVGAKQLGKAAVVLGLGGSKLQDTIGSRIGVVDNPVERAMLDGVPLRDHSFSFKLVPRNQKENASVDSIIREIRSRMMPYNSGGEFFFQFPEVVDFGFNGSFSKQPYKTSVVTSLKVDYAPDGASFHIKDGEATAYVLTIGLKEIQPIRKDDFGNVKQPSLEKAFESTEVADDPGNS
jgi:hypothetical protein